MKQKRGTPTFNTVDYLATRDRPTTIVSLVPNQDPNPALPSDSDYPLRPEARSRWILERRPAREPTDPFRPHGFFMELERMHAGNVVPCPTILLTNRECPWHCLMCDLWKTTVTESIPPGAIPIQLDFAFGMLGLKENQSAAEEMQLKLYNGGSFFDPRAIPPDDFPEIAERVKPFSRIVVESHPAMVNDSCLRFRDLLMTESSDGHTPPRLELALGLETAHPRVLERLNKGMTLDLFSRAARFLRKNEIGLRVFVLVKPPFLNELEALEWAQKSIEFAFSNGASVVSLIPTRSGNGAMETLQKQGHFSPPRLRTLETAQAWGIRLRQGRVFADLWNLEKFSECASCFGPRRDRLEQMNHEQALLPEVLCLRCGGTGVTSLAPRTASEF